jgi:glutaredoxin 3
MTAKVTMYCTAVCLGAEALLEQRGVVEIDKIRIDENPAERAAMIARTGRWTVPQIFIGERHVGGCDDLHALDRAGGLLPLLAG